MKRTCRNLLPFVLAVLVGATALTPSAVGQKDSGGVAGIVRDSAGAVVPDAKVSVKDVDRGTEIVVTTSSQGEYVASPLKIGRYSVTAEKVGFKKTVVGPIEVNIQEHPEVDITLQVGSIHEIMTITSEGPQLQTETSELGQVVNGQEATTLPLNGRNFAQLAQLSAGVAPAEPGSRINASYGFSSDGARSEQNNFLLDGVDNNSNLADLLNETAFVIQPSVDAIAEFKVQTNSYSAEFGRGNGAILNAVIKSGTNGLPRRPLRVHPESRNSMPATRLMNLAVSLTSRISSVARWADRSSRTALSFLATTRDCGSGRQRPFWS